MKQRKTITLKNKNKSQVLNKVISFILGILRVILLSKTLEFHLRMSVNAVTDLFSNSTTSFSQMLPPGDGNHPHSSRFIL